MPVYPAASPDARRHLHWPPPRSTCAQPWCLSHVPGACCLVDHHCAGRGQKWELCARALAAGGAPPPASTELPLVDRRAVKVREIAGRKARSGMIFF